MKEQQKRKEHKKSITLIRVTSTTILILLLVLPAIAAKVWTNYTIYKYQEHIESYSYETYEYLLEVAENLFRKDQTIIDIKSKPDDIIIDKFKIQDDKYICKLHWDINKDLKYCPTADINIELSNKLEVISVTSNYSSEEVYKDAFKEEIESVSQDIYLYGLAAELLLVCVIMFLKAGKNSMQ